ncbi:MAG: NnrU family protein [Gammaproteobacteria bacterium]|nr:NnrU family protein [Gammaproteobacteria bacterium]
MTILVIGLLLFLGMHSVAIIAPQGRDALAARLGENAWKGLYSLVSIVGFALIVWGYGRARMDPVLLYAPPVQLRWVTAVLMLPVFPLLLAPYFPGRIRDTLGHPMLAGVKLWAFAHLLSNGMLADVLLFGGFLAWAVMDRISFKRRPQRLLKTAPRSKLNDIVVLVLGLVLYFAFMHGLHARLIGVSPMPV